MQSQGFSPLDNPPFQPPTLFSFYFFCFLNKLSDSQRTRLSLMRNIKKVTQLAVLRGGAGKDVNETCI